MSAPPEFMRELATWRRNVRRFLRESAVTREADSAGMAHEVIRYRQVTGRETVVVLAHVVDTRRRLIALSLEARRRRRAKDEAWFFDLDELRHLLRVSMLDDFDEVHGRTLERAVSRRRQVIDASKVGAAKRRAAGTQTDQRLAATGEDARSHKDAARRAGISPRQERRRRTGK